MTPPTKIGYAGQAWHIENDSDVPDHRATLASWLVKRPGAHPFWQWWLLSVISLRDIEGVPPAHKRYPEAEYEFMIATVDPESHPDPKPEDALPGFGLLRPIDVIVQFHGVTDDQARRIAGLAIDAIVHGMLSPDQDYRRSWESAIRNTVDHFVQGVHE